MLLIFLALAFAANPMLAQDGKKATPKSSHAKERQHRIVFQLTNDDTLVQKSLVRQINHALDAAPSCKIEVVCHSNGITFLVADKTKYAQQIEELHNKGVAFKACENTLRDRKIDKSNVVKQADFVPAGVIEIVKKQEAGWSYLKAGF